MTSRPRNQLPSSVLAWLAPGRALDLVTIGAPTGNLAVALTGSSHRVTITDRRMLSLKNAAHSAPRAQKVIAQAESLPFGTCRFDVVLVSQVLHTLAPELAFPEIARVLKPSGYLSVMYVVRDDSVPWVRRLAALLQEADPTAMKGSYGAESVEQLAASRCFPDIERKDFRMWIPVSRAALIDMVHSRLTLATSDADTMARLVGAVGDLYDSSARAPEPLLLPWRVQCWRTRVDHSELSTALSIPDDALNIRL